MRPPSKAWCGGFSASTRRARFSERQVLRPGPPVADGRVNRGEARGQGGRFGKVNARRPNQGHRMAINLTVLSCDGIWAFNIELAETLPGVHDSAQLWRREG